MSRNLYERAHDCLVSNDPAEKSAAATRLFEDWQAGRLERAPADLPEVIEAGRPDRPELVPPKDLPRRRLGSKEGLAAMIHAIAHIEFNAINLACDAAYRFRDMPDAYYGDWLKVAAEEAYHFGLLRDRLAELDHAYGDFPAHDGLWSMAKKTAHDPLARMALIPRVMEARGLDVTPDMIRRFQQVGDDRTVQILRIILRDEIGHVEAGTRWFQHLCAERGLESEATYFDLLKQYMGESLRCPLHWQARREAGFTETELTRLEELCDASR